jgi:ankyrin repeat protein
VSLDRELLEAAARGDAERVTEFLMGGGDVNARDELGSTLLHAAAAKGHIEVVKLLAPRARYWR